MRWGNDSMEIWKPNVVRKKTLSDQTKCAFLLNHTMRGRLLFALNFRFVNECRNNENHSLRSILYHVIYFDSF